MSKRSEEKMDGEKQRAGHGSADTLKSGAAKSAGGGDASVRGGKRSDGLTVALRSAYQSTVDEGIPDDLMDLISKLK